MMKRRPYRDLPPSNLACSAWALTVCLLLGVVGVVPARAQQPAWQAAMAKADGAYNDAMEKLGERRRVAVQRAGDAWVQAIDAEVRDATRAGDTTLARNLQGKIAAAREAMRVPPERPREIVTFGRHEYALIDEPKTWVEAKEYCERLGGHLLILDNPAEEAFILSKYADVMFWIGATDLWTPGRTLSLDGKPFRGFAAKLEADNTRQIENGIAWAVQAKVWNDQLDGKRIAFICEWD